MKPFVVHSDPGHAWVAVKRDFLTALGILGDITRFSYQRGGTVYLEEDCDVGTLVLAYTAKYGEKPPFKDAKHMDTSSPVRTYDQFDALKDPRDTARAFKALALGDVVTFPLGYRVTTVTIVGFNPKGHPLGQAPDYDRPFSLRAKHVGSVVKA